MWRETASRIISVWGGGVFGELGEGCDALWWWGRGFAGREFLVMKPELLKFLRFPDWDWVS